MKIRVKACDGKVRVTFDSTTVAMQPDAAVKLAQMLLDGSVEARPGRVDWKAMADSLAGFLKEGRFKP